MKCIFFYFDVLEQHFFWFGGLFFHYFLSFWSSWRGLGDRGILGDHYFQKWAPRLDGSMLFEICVGSSGGLGGSLDGLGVVLEIFKTCFGPLGTYFELFWSLFESSWSLSEGSRRRPRLRRTFIFKNERFASTGTRFLKPVRARTGSELPRERMLSRGMEEGAGRESEQTRG